MPSEWVPDIAIALNRWLTGEDGMAFVLHCLAEELAFSNDVNACEQLVTNAVRKAQEMIASGRFAQPDDWLMSVTTLLNASRVVDSEGIVRDEVKVQFFKSVFQDLANVSRNRAFEEELGARGGWNAIAADLQTGDSATFFAEHPAIQQVMHGIGDAFWSDIHEVESAKKSMPSAVFAESYGAMLAEPSSRTTIMLLLSQSEDEPGTSQLSVAENEFLDRQIREYNELKRLWLRLLYVEGRSVNWSAASMNQELERWRKGRPFMEAYGKFSTRLLAREMLKKLSLLPWGMSDVTDAHHSESVVSARDRFNSENTRYLSTNGGAK